MTKALRWLAVAGVAGALLLQSLSDDPWGPRDARAALAVPVVLAAAALVLALPPLRRSTRAVLQAPDVLVPLGLAVGANALSTRLGAWVPALHSLLPLEVLKVQWQFSGSFALAVVIAVVAAAWTTLLLLDLAGGRPVDLAGGLRRVPRAVVAVFAAGALGYGLILLGLVALIVAATPFSMAAAVLGAVVVGVGWNLWTAGLLPSVLSSGRSLREGLRAGFAPGFRRVKAWAVPVVLQMLVLGTITAFHVTYAHEARTGEGTRRSGTTTKTSYDAHAKWVGGYEAESDWYGDFAKALEAGTRAAPSTVLLLGMLFLAVVVKAHVVRAAHPARSAEAAGRDARPAVPRRPPYGGGRGAAP